MKNRQRIQDENIVAHAIRRNQWFSVVALSMAAAVSILLNIVLFYAYQYRFPQSKFLYTNDAQSVCAPISLQEPNVSSAKVRDFAATASRAVSTYDFYNWRPQLNTALQSYFTPAGRDNFRVAMQQAGVVRSVVENFQVTSAAVRGAPEITSEGVKNGRYTWVVRVPMQIYYRTSAQTKRENRIITSVVERTDVSPVNPLGIAIANMVSTQATTNEFGVTR